MRSLLNFLLRFKTLILFLVLETVALVMISSSHNYHQSVAFGAARTVSGFFARRLENSRSYLRLKQINQQLVTENLILRRQIEELRPIPRTDYTTVHDTVNGTSYSYLSATVINNSVNKQKNFITLDRGSNHGVATGMGVASAEGITGVVVGVSRNFSVAMSLLNTDFRLSARIASNDYFGSLAWDGKNFRYAQLSEIPHHVAVNQGDTIVSSGYSAIFPEGIVIGTLTGDMKKGGDFVTLKVQLSADFKKLTDVYIIGNLNRAERDTVEAEVIDE
ncbi:MAG: rod shape-determining protein MreC [Bacteroidales bacterium]|jgi:rod shape-determining protein MreC|nr:rod shape-determining protein MreC [Bacteroidales bacterium]